MPQTPPSRESGAWNSVFVGQVCSGVYANTAVGFPGRGFLVGVLLNAYSITLVNTDTLMLRVCMADLPLAGTPADGQPIIAHASSSVNTAVGGAYQHGINIHLPLFQPIDENQKCYCQSFASTTGVAYFVLQFLPWDARGKKARYI